MSQPSQPSRIEPLNKTEMMVAWNSGEKFALPYFELRFHCPCAVCVDEMTGKRVLTRESVSQEIRPSGVTPVGRYAIQVNWSDGHSTGMYHFDRLHDLCVQFGKKI